MPTVDVVDGNKKRVLAANGSATVGATGATEITTVDIADGWVFHLMRAECDFTGTTLLSNSRGMIIREELSGGNTELVSVSTDGTFTPASESLTYHNDNGETATIALRGFHGDTTNQDMFGHMTWEAVSYEG